MRAVLIKLLLLCLLPMAALAQTPGLTDFDGKPRSISEFVGHGRWTVVMFWESSCGICAAEAPRLEAFHQRFKDSKAQALGLAVDGSSRTFEAEEFVREHGLTFKNLMISAEQAALLYHDETGDYLPGTPGFLVYGRDGEVRTYQTGALDLAMLERFIERYEAMAAVEQ